jgi:hypothetical protein
MKQWTVNTIQTQTLILRNHLQLKNNFTYSKKHFKCYICVTVCEPKQKSTQIFQLGTEFY